MKQRLFILSSLPVTRSLALTLVLLLGSTPAWPWGKEGHRAVALVAENLLTRKTEDSIRRLMGNDVSLADLATCADEVRTHERNPSFQLSAACSSVFPNPPTGTSHWHFVNIEVSAKAPTDAEIEQFCGDDCVIKQIARFTKALTDGASTRPQRQQALAFLIHFVGDLHQPLHAAVRNGDEGGNKVFVNFFDLHHEKLHPVWDDVIIQHIAANETTLVSGLKNEIQQAQKEPTLPIGHIDQSVLQWARESLKAAHDVAYQNIQLPPAVTPLDANYQKAAAPVVSLQIARGGVRLANLLNQAMK